MTDAPTTRETADHIGEANEKVVQTPMHRDAAKAALALRTADHAELEYYGYRAFNAGIGCCHLVANPGLNDTNPEPLVTAASAKALLSEIAALRGQYELDSAIIQGFSDRLTQAERQRDELRKALEWYGEQARLARLIHREGDAGRHALADDGGKLARQALANQGADQ